MGLGDDIMASGLAALIRATNPAGNATDITRAAAQGNCQALSRHSANSQFGAVLSKVLGCNKLIVAGRVNWQERAVRRLQSDPMLHQELQ